MLLIERRAILNIFWQSLKKLNPLSLWHNPVMFITEIGAVITTTEWLFLVKAHASFYAQVSIWLWLTVLFANFAESMAEARNERQAESLRKGRVETMAQLREKNGTYRTVNWKELKKGDVVKVSAGEIIPGDGEIIEGMASVDESAITGESAPVIRGAGTDHSSVTGGTKLISDELLIQISSEAGHGFLDRMIDLIENAKRKKSLNEIALTILLSGLTIIFLVVVVSMEVCARYFQIDFSVTMLVALLICLIPTTIAGLLSAIGIAGINRLMTKNVLAMSGQAVEVAGDVDLILIDKTGTITIGHRHASDVTIAPGISESDFVQAAYLSSLQDQTDEGRSIVEYLKTHYPSHLPPTPSDLHFIPFTAQTRMSGADIGNKSFRKGSRDAVEKFTGSPLPSEMAQAVKSYAEEGGTPLIVCDKQQVLGVILLKDKVKEGLSQLFTRFRAMGIRTVMMTGDNPITAATIAKEAGVDDFLAEVSPEQKLEMVKKMQAEGHLVAMTGDGVNDAPALAHADVGVAMNSGTQAAKEAGNMIDLDSHPTKLFEIIEIGKQMLMTRGALTAFSVANDVAKYFAIVPAIFMPFFPSMRILNIMNLVTPQSAVLSAVIFNAIIIPILIPLAFRGVKFLPQRAIVILRRNLIVYGLGGILLPFIGIKLIDLALIALGVPL
ncbi:MAG: potassium-transporting ATPase subunit KdpB [Verrucomicrobiota bacterium]|nr:potassium-transporting ATPase subunit KdpB [Verrucomicrobiota bacterium]